MIFSIVLIVLVFSALVIAHEWGHFIIARRNGVTVEEFGIGFPPKLWGYKRKGKKNATLFSINALPIGGFVRLKGEDGNNSAADSFAVQKTWPKTKIVMAGVTMNLLIAYVLLVILLVAGIPPLVQQDVGKIGPFSAQHIATSPITVLAISKNSAAQKAGLKVGNQILAINGQTVATTEQVQGLTKQLSGQTVDITIKAGSTEKNIQATLGNDEQAGYLGVAAEPIQSASYGLLQAFGAAAILVVELVIATIAAFGNFIIGLFTKAQVSQNVAGPIGIVSIFGNVINFGWRYVLAFVAAISLSLAVINALPIPALDGGRLMVIWAQRLGVKITPKSEQWIHFGGFVFLIGLVIIVSISDLWRVLH